MEPIEKLTDCRWNTGVKGLTAKEQHEEGGDGECQRVAGVLAEAGLRAYLGGHQDAHRARDVDDEVEDAEEARQVLALLRQHELVATESPDARFDASRTHPDQ